MLLEMARMSVDDGLVMTIHPVWSVTTTPETFSKYARGHRARHPDDDDVTPIPSAPCSNGR
jgi:glucuronate isomerase